MKILLAFYPIDDMGGIINHTIQLAAGFKELGHTVEARVFTQKPKLRGIAGGTESYSGEVFLHYDQRKGFTWPKTHCIAYGGEHIHSAMQELAKYDMIIWQIAVPTKRKENQGNSDWIQLYNSGKTQYAVIHDGNFLDSYPWLNNVANRMHGLICVHNCAYNSARNISLPSALIFNPQEITIPDLSREAFESRVKGFLSVQTWKAWKRVPELLSAVPHTHNLSCLFAGKGIDYYYLTSEDKCKYPGVWEKAMLTPKTIYYGVITNEDRDRLLRRVTCMVDNSWSKKYAAIGAHFNRVAIDAIMQGAVPVMRNMAVKSSIFIHGVNCLLIPDHISPQKIAGYLDDYCNLDYDTYHRIMKNAVTLLPLFERKKVAGQIVNYDPDQWGNTTPEVKEKGDKVMREFFGADV